MEDIPDGPIMGKVPKVIKPPVGRGLRLDRSAERRAGIFHRQRRFHAAVSPARAAAIVYQSAGAGPDGRGGLVADVVAMIGTLDIVLGEVDR